MVTTEHARGFRVAAVSCRELAELCELRILIEGEALRRSTQFGDRAWEGRVVAAFYQLDRIDRMRTHGELPLRIGSPAETLRVAAATLRPGSKHGFGPVDDSDADRLELFCRGRIAVDMR